MSQKGNLDVNVREFKDFIFASNVNGQWAAIRKNGQSTNDVLNGSVDALEANLVIRTNGNAAEYDAAVERWNSFDTDLPFLYIVHLTQRCNLTCGFCHSAAVGVDALGKDVTYETLDTIARFIASAPGLTKTIAFQGGEPLLCIDRIAYFQSKLKPLLEPGARIHYGVTTNATLLDDVALQALQALSVRVSISVDGPEALHDIDRRYEDGTGSYSKTIENRNRARNLYPRIYAGQIMVVTAQSAPHFKEIVDEYLDAGEHLFRFKMVTPLGRGKQYAKRGGSLGIDEAVYYHKEVIKYLREKYYNSGALAGELYALTVIRKLFEKVNVGDVDSRNKCGIARNVVDFDIRGNIHACHETSKYRPFLLGNARQTYREIYGSELASKIRSLTDLSQHSECRSCPYFNYCTPCPAKNYQESGFPDSTAFGSAECTKTIALMDLLIQELNEFPEYYLRLWQNNALQIGLKDLVSDVR
ncbi:radical SAM/SPASM domain-containing protein [Sinorhizobium meliloti]|uniref:radical SAM/SPASM domain-containing protein n=1 Tax=Rhizobium meliloti TaxID=382 RepID=UPI0013E33FE9|nr:radical SAM protein [Sinorhizobium meliloti]